MWEENLKIAECTENIKLKRQNDYQWDNFKNKYGRRAG